MNFSDKKVSVKTSIAILAKNGIQVDEEEAAIILDFLYLIAKNHKRSIKDQNPKEKSNYEKMQ